MGLHDVEASLKLPRGPDEGDHEANVGGRIGYLAEHVSLKIVGSSDHREAWRYGQSGGRQLAKVGALPSNQFDIG